MKKIYLLICCFVIAYTQTFAQEANKLWERKVDNPILITQISPDGRYLLDSESNHYLFDLQDINKPPVAVSGLLDNPHFTDNNYIVSKSSTQISIYDVATNTHQIVNLDFIDPKYQIVLAYNEKYIVVKDHDWGLLRVYDLVTKEVLNISDKAFEDIWNPIFSKENDCIVSQKYYDFEILNLNKLDTTFYYYNKAGDYPDMGPVLFDSVMIYKISNSLYTYNYRTKNLIKSNSINSDYRQENFRKVCNSDSIIIFVNNNNKSFTTFNIYSGNTTLHHQENADLVQFSQENDKLIGYIGIGDGIIRIDYSTGEQSKILNWNCQNIENLSIWDDKIISFENAGKYILQHAITDTSYSAVIFDYRSGEILDSLVYYEKGSVNRFDDDHLLFHRGSQDSTAQLINISTMQIEKLYAIQKFNNSFYHLGDMSGKYYHVPNEVSYEGWSGCFVDISTNSQAFLLYDDDAKFKEWVTNKEGFYEKYAYNLSFSYPLVLTSVVGSWFPFYEIDKDEVKYYDFSDKSSYYIKYDKVYGAGVPNSFGLKNMKNLQISTNNYNMRIDDDSNTYIYRISGFGLHMKIENVQPTFVSENFKFFMINTKFHRMVIETEYNASVEDGRFDIGIKVYPNPSTESISIENASDDIRAIEIYDAEGKMCMALQNSDGKNIDVSNLPNGSYIAKMIVSGVAISKPFIISK